MQPIIKTFGRLLACSVFLPSVGLASGDSGTKIVASCSPWPPYVVEGERPGGILVDYVEELLNSFGYKAQIEIYPWKRAIDSAQDGTVDVIFCAEAGQAKTYGLEYEFPILISDTILLSHRDYPLDSAQLWHHRIAVGAGYWYGDVFESRRDDVDIIEVVDDLSIMRMIASKRADGGLMEKAVADTLIHTYPELGEMLHISSQPVATQTFYFATSPASDLDMRHLRRHLAIAKPRPIIQQVTNDTN
ncbi:substrate-binding periplasmic protein [Thalassospira aquimaris]|nr:transporter substrate-binding domain-containing protein [Thalassospira sp. FZY0004]